MKVGVDMAIIHNRTYGSGRFYYLWYGSAKAIQEKGVCPAV